MTQPISMPWSAPVFGPLPHRWKGVKVVAFPFTPNADTLEAILPPPLRADDGPGMITMLTYPPSHEMRIHAFIELVVLVPVRLGDLQANYVPYIYVTTDEALIPGREAAGWPKRLADISWQRDGDHFTGRAVRWGTPILTLEGDIDGPMPDEFAGLQSEAVGKPTLNYKIIPGPAGEIEVEEITLTRLEMDVEMTELGTGRVHCENGESDPLAALVPDSEGALVVLVSNNTIPAGEVVQRVERRMTV